jgi:hypothetical protein
MKVSGKENKISYLEFFDNIKKSHTKLNFLTKEDVNEKIKNPESYLDSSDLELFSKLDL